MNKSIAGFDICAHNLGHVVSRISGALLEDRISTADRTAIISVGHEHALLALQILRGDFSSDSVEEQDIRQQFLVGKNSVKLLSKVGKRLVGRRKDGPLAAAERHIEFSCFYGSAESRKVVCAASNLSFIA